MVSILIGRISAGPDKISVLCSEWNHALSGGSVRGVGMNWQRAG